MSWIGDRGVNPTPDPDSSGENVHRQKKVVHHLKASQGTGTVGGRIRFDV
jgi:hypothetical protein